MFVKVYFFIRTFLNGVLTLFKNIQIPKQKPILISWQYKLFHNRKKYLGKKNINNELNNLVHFDNLQVDVQKKMKIILTTSYKCSSFLKEYDAYQNMWNPVKG